MFNKGVILAEVIRCLSLLEVEEVIENNVKQSTTIEPQRGHGLKQFSREDMVSNNFPEMT